MTEPAGPDSARCAGVEVERLDQPPTSLRKWASICSVKSSSSCAGPARSWPLWHGLVTVAVPQTRGGVLRQCLERRVPTVVRRRCLALPESL